MEKVLPWEEPEEVPEQVRTDFKQSNHEIKRLGAGQSAATYLFIDKDTADEVIDIIKARKNQGKKALYRSLRLNIRVVKYKKTVAEGNDILNEVMILDQVLAVKNPRIIEVFEYDQSHLEDAKWSTWPLCSGGDLQALLVKFQTALPVSFLWHVLYQTIEALLFLHHGITAEQKEPVEDWDQVWHGDLHCGNVFLQLDPSSTFGGYPNIVLGDFGAAVRYDDPGNSDTDDIIALGQMTRETACWRRYGDGPDTAERWTAEERELVTQGDELKAGLPRHGNVASSLGRLRRLMDLAAKKRIDKHKWLPAPVVEYLIRDIVTDEELEDMVIAPKGSKRNPVLL